MRPKQSQHRQQQCGQKKRNIASSDAVKAIATSSAAIFIAVCRLLRHGGVLVDRHKDLVEKRLKVVPKNTVHDEAL